MDNFGNAPMPPDLDEGEYHVSQAGLQYGPFRLAELMARALTSDMLIWKPGMPDWRPIEEVTELIPYVRRVAPMTLAIPPALPVPRAIESPAPPPMPLPERSALVTAMAVLNCAFGAETFAVDTHIFRVSNRTGLAPGKNPLAVELQLMKRVPAAYAVDSHHWLILLGRYVCQARKPRCWECVVSEYCEYRPKTLAP
jgi:hypothetical protein